MQSASMVFAQRFGLADDELLAILDVTALELVSDRLDHKPQLALLLALTDEIAQEQRAGVLERWVRTAGPHGRPLDLLLAHDFGTFESAVEALRERGFVVGG